MDILVKEPVLWLKESSISKELIGATDNHGFQIIRAVPTGQPKRITPPPLDKKSLIDIKATYTFLTEQSKAEWNTFVDAANENIGVLVMQEMELGFDWAANLLKVNLYCLFFVGKKKSQ